MSGYKHNLYALGAGIIFGLGLAVSQMTNPDKVLNFLDLFGRWDPSLAIVMASALAISIPGFWFLRKRAKHCEVALAPVTQKPDQNLMIGAVLFGAGWGLAGYCPGPAIANISQLSAEVIWFLPAMILGLWLADLIKSKQAA